MDTTIRNLDEDAYRALKSWAALRGVTVGQAMSEIIHERLGRPDTWPKRGSLRDLPMFKGRKGDETLSQDVDRIVYGL